MESWGEGPAYYHFRRNACASTTAELFPEERHRPALKRKDEEEVYAENLNAYKRDPEDNSVRSLDCNSKQEDTDAEFEEEVRCDVDWFANPPPLIPVR